MNYDFDKVVDRKNTDSVKYDLAVQHGKPHDALPFWVADMDFKVPPCVADALRDRVDHGIFGYSETGDEYFDVLKNWFLRRFNWEIKRDWLIETPGVVTALYIGIRAVTKPGDGILIQQPVYHPFANAINALERKLVVNQLILQNGKYIIDFEDFEKKIIEESVKLFILCSPHNPVGRVWSEEELIKLGDICLKHGVLVIADEIHADLIYSGHTQLVFSDLKPAFLDICITCTAPSKTFNLAGLQLANLFIANAEIRSAFLAEFAASGLSQSNALGIVSCQAAYNGGEEWLTQLLEYLTGNLDFMRQYLAAEIPQISIIEPEGTYLVWVDFRKLGLSSEALNEFISYKAKLWLSNGPLFGMGGEGFQRVNIACPRATLHAGLTRLKDAVSLYYPLR